MLAIHLPRDLEDSLRAEVSRGRFASLDAAIAEAARLLLGQADPPKDEMVEGTAFDVLDRLGLIGCLEGSPGEPTDSSTNPIHMEGFGHE